MAEVLVELQRELRGELKDPLGPIYTDTDALLADTDGPIIAVGDIVTYHLLEAGRRPDVALVDGKTKRERVEREILDAIEGFDHQREVENPPATLTAELLEALDDAIDSVPEGGSIFVSGQYDGTSTIEIDKSIQIVGQRARIDHRQLGDPVFRFEGRERHLFEAGDFVVIV